MNAIQFCILSAIVSNDCVCVCALESVYDRIYDEASILCANPTQHCLHKRTKNRKALMMIMFFFSSWLVRRANFAVYFTTLLYLNLLNCLNGRFFSRTLALVRQFNKLCLIQKGKRLCHRLAGWLARCLTRSIHCTVQAVTMMIWP